MKIHSNLFVCNSMWLFKHRRNVKKHIQFVRDEADKVDCVDCARNLVKHWWDILTDDDLTRLRGIGNVTILGDKEE